jgi:hypothetical protein
MQMRARGVALIRIAAVYMVIGLGMGIFMAVARDHRLASVHGHLTLLGWATMALTGLVYIVMPPTARGALAASHFWLHNLGLPLMLVSLAAYSYGLAAAEPMIGVGAVVTAVALGLFAASVLRRAE